MSLKFNQATWVHLSAILLLLLTLLSIGLSRFYPNLAGVTVMLVLFTIIKGQQITDVFMELKHAPLNWRLFLLAYVVILPVILAAILYL